MSPTAESKGDKQGSSTDSGSSEPPVFKYFGRWERPLVRKVFCVLGVIGGVLLAMYLDEIGYFDEIYFETSEVGIDQIPFPAITITNGNRGEGCVKK